MIDPEKLNKGWIEKVTKENLKADKILVVKVIRALLLLGGLARQKIPLVFKGEK